VPCSAARPRTCRARHALEFLDNVLKSQLRDMLVLCWISKITVENEPRSHNGMVRAKIRKPGTGRGAELVASDDPC